MSQDEELLIVDEHDQVIGRKARKDVTDDDCWRIVSIWVENSQGQVLMQQRSFDKRLAPGQWTPAAEGTVIGNASYEETAKKELFEEIGLKGVSLQPTKKIYLEHWVLGGRQCQGYKVLCDWPIEKFTVEPGEVADLRWLDKQKLVSELTDRSPRTYNYADGSAHWVELFNLR